MKNPVSKRRKPIDTDRLRAARDAGGFESSNKLAKKAHVPHSAISRVLSGRVRQVNDATLRRLSRTLRVPTEWLTGERDDLPHVPQFEYPQTPSAAPSRSGARRSLWQRPTADYVRWSWLMQRIEAAVRRDLEAWCGPEAKDAYESWGRSLLTVFAEMAHSFVWRLALQRPAREGTWNELWQVADVPTIEWLEHAIEPWLEGRAYLNADVIRKNENVLPKLFSVLLDAPQRLWDSGVRDSDARRALEEYAKLRANAVKMELDEIGPPEPERNVPGRKRRTKSGVSSRKGRRGRA